MNTNTLSEAIASAAPATGDAPSQGAAPHPSALEMFRDALKIDDAPPPEEGAPPADDKPPAKPKRLKELAAFSKLSDDELYGIEVPSKIEGQEPYTIGKLKDLAAEHDDFTVRQLETEQRHRDREAQLLRTEQELRELFAALPPDAIKPELRKSLQDKRDKATMEERQRVLEVIPEWQNRDIRTQELGAMIEHLKGYGFPESYLSGVIDHRTLRYIRANMVREARLSKALEKVKQHKSTTPTKGTKPTAPAKPASGAGRPKTPEQRAQENFSKTLFGNQQR